jgi:hypothetical protein
MEGKKGRDYNKTRNQVSSYLSVIRLSINRFNSPIKEQVSEWIFLNEAKHGGSHL